MPSIDSRIVEMRFDRAQFGQGVASTLADLSKLSQGLKLPGATSGLDKVASAAQKTNLNPLATSIGAVTSRFSALQVAGVTALVNIANRAVNAGTQLAKSLTIAPLSQGFGEYETKLGSIQTILANTSASGATLKDVNRTLEDLNRYSDQTIYNFAEMAKNIGTFTAAGVDLETATSSIKGIANLAALSGSSSQQAAGAMYQLSQEISAGRVSLMGWNSVVNAGMGGTVFQRALAETAVAMGKMDGSAVKLSGSMKNVTINGKSFRESIDATNGPSWLTSDVLTTALRTFTGDMTAAQLKTIGFTETQVQGILAQAKAAKDAATIVKTGTALIGTLQEAAASGWARTWEIIFGDFEEAKKMWTSANNVLGGMINAAADRRNELLSGWKDLGGRDMLLQGIGDAFKALMAVIAPVREAFQQIFPPKTAQDLLDLTTRFAEFAKSLQIGSDTAALLKRTFAGIFAVFSIVKQVISAAVGAIVDLIQTVGKGSGGFLEFTAGVGDFIVALDAALRKSGVLKAFFNGIASVIKIPLGLISGFGSAFSNIFTGLDGGGAAKVTAGFGKIQQGLEPLAAAAERVKGFFDGLGRALSRVGDVIGDGFVVIGQKIAAAFSGDNLTKSLDVINTGLIGGILLLLKNFTSGGLVSLDFGGGLFDSVKDTLGSVQDTLVSMQQSVKADILLKIAGALALLAASILVLATIDSGKLKSSLAAMTVGFIGLNVALVTLSKFISLIGMTKLPLITLSLVALASAMLVLALAVKVFSTMSWDEIARGLLGFAGALLIVTAAAIPLAANAGGMIRASISIGILAVAMNIMALALKQFAAMSWVEMGQGLAGLAASLLLIIGAMRLMPTNMVAQAIALGILAAAINGIAIALRLLAGMDLANTAQALVALGGSLLIIAAAMHLMPKNMVAQAAALVAVSVALNLLGVAMRSMAGMSYEEIARGLIALGGALLVLAGGLHLMNGTVGGSAALTLAAIALGLLVPVLVTLGSLQMETIAKGLGTIAGVFIVLGAAGLLLGPIVPVVLGLAAALLLIGVGFGAAGAGALAFATAFGIVVAAGAAGVAVLAQILKTFVDAIPGALKAFGKGIVEFAKVIASAGKAFFQAFTTIISSILKAIVDNVPKIVAAFFKIITEFLRVIAEGAPKVIKGIADALVGILNALATHAPRIVAAFANMIVNVLNALTAAVPRITTAGANLIIAILNGIARNIGRIVTAAVNVVTQFINGIAANMGRIVQSGVNLIISFVNGVANAIRTNSAAMGKAGANLADAVVDGMRNGLTSGIKSLAGAAARMAKSALDAAKGVLGIKSPSKEFEKVGKFVVEGFAKGMTGNNDQILAAYSTTRDLLAAAMKGNREDIAKLEKRLATLKGARKQDVGAIRETSAALAEARKELATSTAAHKELTVNLIDERHKLQGLAGEYATLQEKLKEANDVLESAKKTRDDYNKNLTDSYSDLPSIDKDTKLGDYLEELRKKVADTNDFSVAVQKLRDMGLNDSSYKELIAKGVDALPFVNQLLEGGQSAVDEVNLIGSNLISASKVMADNASRELYQAGVDVAQGMVDGLSSQTSHVVAQMEALANEMLTAMKVKLGIKSPSREFAKLGAFSVEGLAKGLEQGTRTVEVAASNVGGRALGALRDSISNLATGVGGELSFKPVITPVLDLTDVRKGAQLIGPMLTKDPLTVGGAYSSAAHASAGYNANRSAQLEEAAAVSQVRPSVTFHQYNTSPKALAQAEIYRQTNNQLSRAKGALTGANSG